MKFTLIVSSECFESRRNNYLGDIIMEKCYKYIHFYVLVTLISALECFEWTISHLIRRNAINTYTSSVIVTSIAALECFEWIESRYLGHYRYGTFQFHPKDQLFHNSPRLVLLHWSRVLNPA